MRFTSTRSGESLDDLVSRAYAFKGRATRADRQAAGKALVDANPFLKRLDDVPEDTLVAVPGIGEAQPAAATSDLGSTAVTAMLTQLRQGAAALAASLEADIDEAIATSRESIRLVRSGDFKKLTRTDPAVAEEAKEAAKVAEARIEDARALDRYRRSALARLEKDADELLATFGETEAPRNASA